MKHCDRISFSFDLMISYEVWIFSVCIIIQYQWKLYVVVLSTVEFELTYESRHDNIILANDTFYQIFLALLIVQYFKNSRQIINYFFPDISRFRRRWRLGKEAEDQSIPWKHASRGQLDSRGYQQMDTTEWAGQFDRMVTWRIRYNIIWYSCFFQRDFLLN